MSLIALLWGFAEATVFFFVPDVFLTFIALRSWRRAMQATAFALAGAIAGGAATYWFAASHPNAAREILVRIPAIHERLLRDVSVQLQDRGLLGVFLGPLRGIPYKIYAVEWGARHGSLIAFLLVSLPARAIRFVATASLASLIAKMLRRRITERAIVAIHLCAWTVFYAAYFFEMSR